MPDSISYVDIFPIPFSVLAGGREGGSYLLQLKHYQTKLFPPRKQWRSSEFPTPRMEEAKLYCHWECLSFLHTSVCCQRILHQPKMQVKHRNLRWQHVGEEASRTALCLRVFPHPPSLRLWLWNPDNGTVYSIWFIWKKTAQLYPEQAWEVWLYVVTRCQLDRSWRAKFAFWSPQGIPWWL